MAGIFVEGDPKGLTGSELRINFADKPAFRLNHGILTPSVIGKVHLGLGEPRNAYLPCRDEADAKLLAGTFVTFDRLAQYGSELYVDVRDSENFWSGVHPKFRPSLNSKTYMLPSQGQDKEGGVQYRYLMVKDFTRAAHDLISDFEYNRQESNAELEAPKKFEHPGTQALRLARELKGVVFVSAGEMYQQRPEIQEQLEFLGSLGGLLKHLGEMGPSARRAALNLPPKETWRAIALDRQARSGRVIPVVGDNKKSSIG